MTTSLRPEVEQAGTQKGILCVSHVTYCKSLQCQVKRSKRIVL